MAECTRIFKTMGHSYEPIFDESEKFPANLNIETIIDQCGSNWSFDSYDVSRIIDSLKEHTNIYVGSVCKYCGDFLPRYVGQEEIDKK